MKIAIGLLALLVLATFYSGVVCAKPCSAQITRKNAEFIGMNGEELDVGILVSPKNCESGCRGKVFYGVSYSRANNTSGGAGYMLEIDWESEDGSPVETGESKKFLDCITYGPCSDPHLFVKQSSTCESLAD
jgi:hypothetical protein